MANAGFMQKKIGACHKRLYKMPNPPCLIDRRDCITSFNGMSHHWFVSLRKISGEELASGVTSLCQIMSISSFAGTLTSP